MHKPLVALDCDGLLADWLDGTLDAITEVTGKRFQKQEVTSWNPWLQFKLQPEEVRAVMQVIDQPGFCESLGVLPGAQAAYDALRQISDVVIVTSPWLSAPSWTFERTKWLARNFGIGPEYIIHTSAKEYVGADYFFDDNPQNVRWWWERNKGCSRVWDATYNKGYDWARVTGWPDVLDLVGAYELLRGPQ